MSNDSAGIPSDVASNNYTFAGESSASAIDAAPAALLSPGDSTV